MTYNKRRALEKIAEGEYSDSDFYSEGGPKLAPKGYISDVLKRHDAGLRKTEANQAALSDYERATGERRKTQGTGALVGLELASIWPWWKNVVVGPKGVQINPPPPPPPPPPPSPKPPAGEVPAGEAAPKPAPEPPRGETKLQKVKRIATSPGVTHRVGNAAVGSALNVAGVLAWKKIMENSAEHLSNAEAAARAKERARIEAESTEKSIDAMDSLMDRGKWPRGSSK